MNYILFDDELRSDFLPLTYTRPMAELFFGAFTNRQRWEKRLGKESSSLVPKYLSGKFPLFIEDDNLLINARLIPNDGVFTDLVNLKMNQKLVYNNNILGVRLKGVDLKEILDKMSKSQKSNELNVLQHTDLSPVSSTYHVKMLEHVWDLYSGNEEMIVEDVKSMSLKEFSGGKSVANTEIGDEIHIHKSAKVTASILNATSGPIIIDEGAEIMEGSLIRGPVYIGKNAVVKMGAKIYGATSIGNFSKVGGEINNSIVFSFSNKAHDGFLGNSVIGEWCNLGADTNTSNLKNDYSIVKLWNYGKGSFVKTGQQFLGLVMGDHSKCGINTMFNTGTIVGVSCNIFGAGFLPNHIPAFSWGKTGSFETFKLEKAIEVSNRVMERRKLKLSGDDENILKSVFEQSEEYRSKFN